MNKLIATFEKNKFEEVRVQVREYKGYDLIDIRIWTDVKGTEDRVATAKGLSLNVEHFGDLKKAVMTLEKELKENNLLPEEA